MRLENDDIIFLHMPQPKEVAIYGRIVRVSETSIEIYVINGAYTLILSKNNSYGIQNYNAAIEKFKLETYGE